MRSKFGTVLAVLAMSVYFTGFINAGGDDPPQPSASPDSGYPIASNSISQGQPATSGQGFTASVYDGSAGTTAVCYGSLKADIEGQGKLGFAHVWDDKEWHGTISDAGAPMWAFSYTVTLSAHVDTHNHYAGVSRYNASATSGFEWWLYEGSGILRQGIQERTVEIQEEQLDASILETVSGAHDAFVAQIEYGFQCSANAHIYTERADGMFVSSKVLDQAAWCIAAAWDGPNQIVGGAYGQG